MHCDTLARKGEIMGIKRRRQRQQRDGRQIFSEWFRSLCRPEHTSQRNDSFNETRWPTSGPASPRWATNKYPARTGGWLTRSWQRGSGANEAKRTGGWRTNIIIHSSRNIVGDDAYYEPLPLMSRWVAKGRRGDHTLRGFIRPWITARLILGCWPSRSKNNIAALINLNML